MPVQKTRDHIVNTAAELFYAKAFNLVGINEIIKKAGVAKATLYAHFKTKEELFLAYLDKMDRDFMRDLQDFVVNKPNGDARLLAIIEFLYNFYNQDGFNGCWCIRSMAEVPPDDIQVRSKIKQNKTRLMSYIKLLVMENIDGLRPQEQDSLSKHIYLIYESAVGEAHLHQSSWPIDQALDLLNFRLSSMRHK